MAAAYMNAAILDTMAAIVATVFPDTCLLHLYNAAIVLNPGTPLATYTAAEATFGGYAAVPLNNALAPYLPAGGGGAVSLGAYGFNWATTPGETEYGWYITNAGATELLAAGVFDAPIGLNAIGDSINILLILEALADQAIVSVVDGAPQ